MIILRNVLIVLEVFCSILLIGLILIQKSKSEGLGLAFGSGMGENLFGSRAGNVLSKLTITFATIFMANTVVLAMVSAGVQERSLMSSQAPAAPIGAPTAPPVGPGQQPAGPPTLPGSPVGEGGVPIQPVTPSAAPAGIPTLPGAELDDTPQVEAVPGPVERTSPVEEEAAPAGEAP